MFPFAYPDTSPSVYGCFLLQPVSTFTPHSDKGPGLLEVRVPLNGVKAVPQHPSTGWFSIRVKAIHAHPCISDLVPDLFVFDSWWP